MEGIKTFSEIDFVVLVENTFASVTYSRELKLMICTARAEYIPIEEFKTLFQDVDELLNDYPAAVFLFDKRALTTFHQPSMEWYFVAWKQQVKPKGLASHFKILPNLPWFVKAVEAGKHEILKKFGPAILEGISVQYISAPEEILGHLRS